MTTTPPSAPVSTPRAGHKWLDDARYLSLATTRRDGREVRTPVWFARDGDVLVLFSAGEAGKVKRIRRTRSGKIAPCDVRGQLAGEWLPVEAELLSAPADIAHAHALLRRRYGWQMLMLDLGARIGGRISKRSFIRLRPLLVANAGGTAPS